ncbi:alpha/beta hydrolase fold domain-containing protein [Streptomyces sp. NPDC054863]
MPGPAEARGGGGARPYPRWKPGPVPGWAADLAGLPPACVAVAEFDPFRDEDTAYGLRLLQSSDGRVGTGRGQAEVGPRVGWGQAESG